MAVKTIQERLQFFSSLTLRSRMIIGTVAFLVAAVGITALTVSRSNETTGTVVIVDCQKTDCRGWVRDAQPPTPQHNSAVNCNRMPPSRIPNGNQGFELGMSMAEVLEKEPNIQKYPGGDGKTSPYDLNDTLQTRRNGFTADLIFYQGCLISIRSTLDAVSPADAAVFDRSILSQLGPPSREVYEGFENRSWVWKDGDTRIRYDDHYLEIPRSRQVDLEIVNTPQFFALQEFYKKTNNSAVLDQDWFINFLRHQWAMDDEPDRLKRMPRGDGTLTLGMNPWQVRAAVQGIQISSISETEMQGNYSEPTSTVDVRFQNQQLSHFCRENREMSYAQFAAVQKRLLEQLGTPMGGWKFKTSGEWNEWEDNEVRIRYSWGPSLHESGTTAALICLYDKALDEQSESQRPPPNCKAPQTHSFF